MTIHHSQLKKAEKIGVILSEEKDIDKVRAYWPKRSVAVYGNSAADALSQMQAAIAIATGDEYTIRTDVADSRLISVINADGDVLRGSPMPPVAAHKMLFTNKDKVEWVTPDDDQSEEDTEAEDTPVAEKKDEVARINGVATNGRIAHAEGTPAGDCPYSSEDEEQYADFERWNAEWDEAADEATEEEGKGGSVVKEKYRAKYAELGHPTHCGDWLAELLNNLVLGKKETDLERFETICSMNGVDTSKYKRSGVGWQGRIRMTGRNLLAKRVFQNGGVLKAIDMDGHAVEYKAPGDWMDSQRYKRAPKPALDSQGGDPSKPYDTPDAQQ